MRHNKYRFIYMAIAGILISLLYQLLIPKGSTHNTILTGMFNSVIITIIIWEGNLRLDNILNRKFPWITATRKRLIWQGISSMLYSAGSLFFISFFVTLCFGKVSFSGNLYMIIASLTLGLMVSVILLTFEVSSQFFSHWKNSLREIERFRAENLQAQLQNLKNQINPHFLFNNLSVLSSLVYQDQDKAVKFIDQLAKVYRYSLDSRNNELITLEEEITFIQSYIYLLKIRFDKGIFISIDADKEMMNRFLPPMVLQTVLENAMKHNESSEESPLKIMIRTDEEILIVSNNIQLRKKSEPNSGTGLQNISERYKFFTTQIIEVINTGKSFIVKLPLLEQ
jgi:two-component system, LytTR family, sensor kinase